MRKGGPKPTPTHLRLLKGDRHKERINEWEPKPKGDLFEPPDWLTADQRDGWTYAIANLPPGLLKRIDRSLLAIWVVAENMHRRACIMQAKLDASSDAPMLTRSPNKIAVQSPYLPIINRQALIMLRAAEQMGFTPASRTRIAIDGAQDDEIESAAAEFFD